MYYEEKVIKSVLHYRTSPKGEWKEISKGELTLRLLAAEKMLDITDLSGERQCT